MDKYKNLYIAVNEMMCELGAVGEIDTSSSLVNDVMNALYDIDGGSYDVDKVFKTDPADKQKAQVRKALEGKMP